MITTTKKRLYQVVSEEIVYFESWIEADSLEEAQAVFESGRGDWTTQWDDCGSEVFSQELTGEYEENYEGEDN